MIRRVDQHLYDMAANQYCGVVMPQNVMRKLTKLIDKYQSEVRKMLYEHADELHSAHWTMALDKELGESIYVYYTLSVEDDADIERRIKLFKPNQPKYVPDFFMVDTHDEARDYADRLLLEKIDEIGS